MGIGIATIAAFLLLLPGVGFIVGVNIADKNVREIVFRNTPAEIGYVIFISLVVHLVLAVATALLALFATTILPQNPYRPLDFIVGCVQRFNAAYVYLKANGVSNLDIDHARNATIFSLTYFLIASVVGFAPGVLLGRWIREQTWGWTAFFVKHRWMLALVQGGKARSVTARVVLKEKLTLDRNGKERPVVVQGVLRDSYFGSDGKLLYLVFNTFSVQSSDALNAPALRGLGAPKVEVSTDDQLLVEGDKIAIARYSQRPLPMDAIDNLELD
jgi:hypothetical protein